RTLRERKPCTICECHLLRSMTRKFVAIQRQKCVPSDSVSGNKMPTDVSNRERLPRQSYDAVVIGSGPNGLAAAITIAGKSRSVLVVEAEPTIGGGARSAELTLPGFVHDLCSAVHPLAVASPLFQSLPLAK